MQVQALDFDRYNFESLLFNSGLEMKFGQGPVKLFDIIHEDADLLVINKPAGLVCHPTKGDEYSSLISRVRLHVGEGVQPQLINRLDRETSGVVILAKRPEPARELRRLWEEGAVKKCYKAIVHGRVSQSAGVIEAPLGRDEQSPVAIKDKVRADGSPSITEFTLVRSFRQKTGLFVPAGKSGIQAMPQGSEVSWMSECGDKRSEQIQDATNPPRKDFSLLAIRPLSGRKHQIRIHLAHWDHPIVGDKIYGGDEQCYLHFVVGRLSEEQSAFLILPYQALHAEQVSFKWRSEEWMFETEPEPWFVEFSAGDAAPGS